MMHALIHYNPNRINNAIAFEQDRKSVVSGVLKMEAVVRAMKGAKGATAAAAEPEVEPEPRVRCVFMVAV
jgi:hypothetical protein